MTDSPDPSKDLLSAFDLGPAWARGDDAKKNYADHPGDRQSKGRRDGDGRGRQGGGRQGGGGQRGDRRGGDRRDDRKGRRGDFGGRGGGPRDLPPAADGVKITVLPSEEAIHLIVKEIQHRARVYSLFDVAQLFLGARERYQLQVDVEEGRPALYRGRKDASLFLGKDEAASHFFGSQAFEELYETEETEVDPPKGNFQVVARCGISGEWLGPPNFHGYQTALRRLHRERFATMPFERYAAKVRTERGEEAVNEWLESMKVRRRWRPRGADDDAWTFERAEIERDFLTRAFDEAFEEVRKTTLPGDVPAQNLSERLLASIKIATSHTRRHPAMIIPSICRMLESDHLAIFKKQGKLYCGPARPHPLVGFDDLSVRPATIVKWLDANPDSVLDDLWKAILPAGTEEPPREWLVDLFWLLSQGHVLLFADGKLVLPKKRHPDAAPTKKKSAAKKQAAPGGTAAPRKPKRKRGKSRPATVPSHAATVRRIVRMRHGALKKLRGQSRLWGRRLARRDRIKALLDDHPTGSRRLRSIR
jgi:hypothetical protein